MKAVGRKFSQRFGNPATVGVVTWPWAGDTAVHSSFFNLDYANTSRSKVSYSKKEGRADKADRINQPGNTVANSAGPPLETPGTDGISDNPHRATPRWLATESTAGFRL